MPRSTSSTALDTSSVEQLVRVGSITTRSRAALDDDDVPEPDTPMYDKGVRAGAARSSVYVRVILVLVGLLLGFLVGRSRRPGPAPSPSALFHPSADVVAAAASAPTLVVYSFAVTDSLSLGNLKFFLHEAVREGDGASYVIVVNLEPSEDMAALGLPRLPANAQYVRHKNECYDWGTYAWALKEVPGMDITKYKYFIFMNSSIRGPFVHPMLAGRLHWTRLFTDAINSEVKLVGPSVSCETYCHTPPGGQRTCIQHPHIQSVAVATDHVGLSVLQQAGTVLACQDSRGDAVYKGEIGASVAIVRAGYNIACFLARYQGVDFRQPKNHKCNAGASPLGIHSFDGLTPGALELVFPKLKESMLDSRLATHVEAHKLSEWLLAEPGSRNISANSAKEGDQQQRAEDVLIAATKGMQCFDFDYYKTKNPDAVKVIHSDALLFKHFLAIGMMEYREHKWKCGLDSKSIIPRWP